MQASSFDGRRFAKRLHNGNPERNCRDCTAQDRNNNGKEAAYRVNNNQFICYPDIADH